jgi:hypothetical protein
MSTEALTRYNPTEFDQEEADFSFERELLPIGPAVVRINKLTYNKPKGKLIAGSLFAAVTVIEGTPEQAGKKTAGQVNLALGIFDDPPAGNIDFNADGSVEPKSEGQAKQIAIAKEQHLQFATAFGLPRRPAGKNEAAITAFCEAAAGKEALTYINIEAERTQDGKTYPARQKFSSFTPMGWVNPKAKGEKIGKTALELFRTQLGANHRSVNADDTL